MEKAIFQKVILHMIKKAFQLLRNKCNWYDYRWQLNNIEASQALVAFGLEYAPWSGASLTPAAMRLVINDVVINQRKYLVELGSGISTLFLAKLASQYGCHFTSVEHDANWIAIMKSILHRNKLSSHVDLLHAPLAPFRDTNIMWYDTTYLESIRTTRIEMLLIDGPPAHSLHNMNSRSCALPWFSGQFSERHSIFLDDIFRQGEKECVIQWRSLGYNFNCKLQFGGLGVCIKGDHFSIE
jgi:hypothetical protein